MGEIKFKNIKHILRKQIDNGVKSLWTYNERELEFTQIYKNYNDKEICNNCNYNPCVNIKFSSWYRWHK